VNDRRLVWLTGSGSNRQARRRPPPNERGRHRSGTGARPQRWAVLSTTGLPVGSAYNAVAPEVSRQTDRYARETSRRQRAFGKRTVGGLLRLPNIPNIPKFREIWTRGVR